MRVPPKECFKSAPRAAQERPTALQERPRAAPGWPRAAQECARAHAQALHFRAIWQLSGVKKSGPAAKSGPRVLPECARSAPRAATSAPRAPQSGPRVAKSGPGAAKTGPRAAKRRFLSDFEKRKHRATRAKRAKRAKRAWGCLGTAPVRSEQQNEGIRATRAGSIRTNHIDSGFDGFFG